MRTTAACLLVMCVGLVKAQEVTVHTERLSNQRDTNNLYIRYEAYYFIDRGGDTEYQKQVIPVTSGNRILKAEFDVTYITNPLWKNMSLMGYFRVDAMPSHYLSVRYGAGAYHTPSQSSLGVFSGDYYRRSPDGNFITRRARRFEDFSLWGVYGSTRRKDFSLFASVGFERTNVYYMMRSAGRVGQTLSAGKPGSSLRSLELLFEYESLIGYGVGFSCEVRPRFRADVLLVQPHQEEQDDFAAVNVRLSPGYIVRLGYYVN